MLCLNIGVDPPDVVKTSPCARKECWIGEFHIWDQVKYTDIILMRVCVLDLILHVNIDR